MGEWVWLKKFEAETAPELRPSCLSLLRKVGLPRGCETPPVGIGPYSVGKRLASKKEVLRSSLAAWWVKDPWSLLWRGFNPGPGERLHAVGVAKKRRKRIKARLPAATWPAQDVGFVLKEPLFWSTEVPWALL